MRDRSCLYDTYGASVSYAMLLADATPPRMSFSRCSPLFCAAGLGWTRGPLRGLFAMSVIRTFGACANGARSLMSALLSQ
jgi:hypothetical protein